MVCLFFNKNYQLKLEAHHLLCWETNAEYGQLVAFETAGACGPSTKAFVKQLGARVAASTGDRRGEHGWVWQRSHWP